MQSFTVSVFLSIFVIVLEADGRKLRRCHKQMPKQQKEEFIINGQLLDITSVPYQCAFNTHFDSGDITTCGCAILNEWFVLTAAHCFDPMLANGQYNMIVKTGINDIRTNGNHYGIKNYMIHGSYVSPNNKQRRSPRADIAVILVDRPIKLDGTYVTTIELVNEPVNKAGLPVYVSGYGKTQSPEQNYKLFGLEQEIFDRSECERMWNANLNGFICAHTEGGTACHGDSGGPVVISDAYGQKLLIGIVSFGVPTCQNFKPTVYTDVYFYRDWIYRAMQRMGQY